MELRRSAVLLLVLGACSGKAKAVEDARSHAGSASDSGSIQTDAQSGQGQAKGEGDVQVRVEWKDVPAVARASAGRTACGTPRAAQVSPSPTWGIPEVFVAIDVEKKVAPTTRPRIVLDQCALEPRVAVAGTTIAIASAADAPAKLGIHKAGQLPLGGALGGTPKPIYLPIAGHEVEVPLEPRGIYQLQIATSDGFDPENAWIVSADTPYVAITEGNGQTTFRDLPVGTYAVHAWLPPRAGQDQRIAHGTVTVAASDLTEVTLNLAP
ncbi:MAG: hypothetical protein HOV81_44820 [Kofleriaceae bacterium]|nr:hypothetical protein [Kofleriaceae bacterium]